MKKLVVSIIVLSLVITGCINKKEVKETKKEEVNSNSDSVVIYFSATGNTEKIAKRIAKQANSDIIEIVPKDKYEDKDLDYNNDCRANKEQNDPKARPKKPIADINVEPLSSKYSDRLLLLSFLT